MNIAIINGSPKGKNSNSSCVVNDIRQYILEYTKDNSDINIHEFIWNHTSCSLDDFKAILTCDAIVLCFPLYIDSIPSHLLRILVNFENYIAEIRKSNSMTFSDINVYVIVNNGFYDGKQNHLAIDNVRHWCKHMGFNLAQGIGIGGGGMLPAIKNVTLGYGPKKTIGIEIKAMCENIIQKNNGETKFLEPNFPSYAYKFFAERNWRKAAKANNLKPSDINKRLVSQ